jgi:[acyl-carrier-protein] S-malonyltransferase
MQGEGQIRRVANEAGWQWHGDFPLTMAAQTAVSVVLADAFLEAYGAPCLVAGESMGGCAACCVAGALSIEQATLIAYRWGCALARASDQLGLRMAVVEDLTADQVAGLNDTLEAIVVVDEAPSLVVVSIPVANLSALQESVGAQGGAVLVSSNACVAHDPRLRQVESIWEEYDAFIGGLEIREPRLALLSALHPGLRLQSSQQVRMDLIETTCARVRWRETIGLLPAAGIRNLVQLCAPLKAYALEKLRSEDDRLQGMRIQTARTLEGILRLGRGRSSVPPSCS